MVIVVICSSFLPSVEVTNHFIIFFLRNTAEEELEISPYDDTSLDTHMASLVAGKLKYIFMSKNLKCDKITFVICINCINLY